MRKYAMGNVRFEESKHERDEGGRFSAKGGGTPPSFRQVQQVESSPGRLLEEKWRPPRGGALFQQGKSAIPGAGHNSRTSWERIGVKNAALPADYTGSTQRELPVDGYGRHEMRWQRPKELTADEHDAIRAGLVDTIKVLRQPSIERAIEARLVPDDTPKNLLNRAYNLASMRALHEYGVGSFDYRMSEPLKQEMMPLVPAMRYFQRRVGDRMRSDASTKGKWQPYKEEFGVPYDDKRLDKRPGKGNQMRLKWAKSMGSHTDFIKATMPGELMKADAIHPGAATTLPIADKIIAATVPQGRRRGPPPGAAPAEVLAVLPQARRIMREGEQRGMPMASLPGRARHRLGETVIRDPRRSLADLLG